MTKQNALIIAVFLALTAFGFAADHHQKAEAAAVATREANAAAEVAANEAAEKARYAAEAKQRTAAAKADGSYCSGVWDGSNRSLVKEVKSELRDPDSFEHENSWFSAPDHRGLVKVKMIFRSKNGFGGYEKGEAIGWVEQEGCNAVLEKLTPLG